MDDLREKVIKGLKCLAGMNEMKSNPCMDCGYQECQTYAICIGEITRDAISLLKEQEPRVMALTEAFDAEVAWLETHALKAPYIITDPGEAITAEAWKELLTKWMEEQNAAD